MRIALMAILMVSFAGCLAEDGPTAPEPEPAPQTPPVVFHPEPPIDKPAVHFRAPVDLGSHAYPVAAGTSCTDSVDDGDCGLGEPSVEVDSAGTIYISGVCCVGNAPPLMVSRDGGATFQDLPGDEVRELLGVEMDFAIDEMGNFYAADIEVAATFQVTVWDAQGNYLHHTKWPAPPLVDRDWIRAEGDGQLYYVYNTGGNTNIYTSSDRGVTWSPTFVHQTGYGLGNAAIDPGVEVCVFGGRSNGMRLQDCSNDQGASWLQSQTGFPAGSDSYPVMAYDEAGTLWMAETRNLPAGQEIYVASRSSEGVWSNTTVISPAGGYHRMPWLAAGADGAVAVAWYGKDGNDTTDGDWFLYAGASKDHGATWDVVRADQDPVFQGSLGRDLLDFLQVDLGPDGSINIAYSDAYPARGPDGNEEQLMFVRSEASPLAMVDFWLGP